MKAIKTWILIADGARARILMNEGPGKGLSAVYPFDFIASRAKTQAYGSDKPGRTFESADGSRHAMAPRVDWHKFGKKLFAKSMAKVLNAAETSHAFDRLILVAPPVTIGSLRGELNAATRKRVTGELGKDITQVPVHDLPAHLEEVMVL